MISKTAAEVCECVDADSEYGKMRGLTWFNSEYTAPGSPLSALAKSFNKRLAGVIGSRRLVNVGGVVYVQLSNTGEPYMFAVTDSELEVLLGPKYAAIVRDESVLVSGCIKNGDSPRRQGHFFPSTTASATVYGTF